MDRQMIDYLPDTLKDIREYKAIMSIEQPECEEGWACAEYALQESFLMTATDYGLSRLETMSKIIPKAGETLDERRFRILSLISSRLPYTYRQLENLLENMCGEGRYKIDLNAEAYTIKVTIEMESKYNYQAVMDLLHQIIPANLVLYSGLYAQTAQTIYVYSTASKSKHYTITSWMQKHYNTSSAPFIGAQASKHKHYETEV